MRTQLTMIGCLLLGACATTNVPPELRDPTAHIRPVETPSEPVFVPDLMAEAKANADLGCEIYRRGAQTGVRGALEAFATCTLESGELHRARAVIAAFDLDLPEARVVEVLDDATRGQLDEVALNAAIEASPRDARLWNLLGAEYERQGRDAEAVDAYVEARRLSR